MFDNDDDDYEVGYGKPPKATRFQPGKSGNPKGRKKVEKNGRELLNIELARKIIVIENGKRKKLTKYEAIIRQFVNNAASGNAKSIRDVMATQRDTGEFEKPAEGKRIIQIHARIPAPQHLSPEQLEKWKNPTLIDGGTAIYELEPEPPKRKKKSW